jgi:tryptophan-rich sensory protein
MGLWNPDNFLWVGMLLALNWHIIHAKRFPSFYAAFLQTKKLRFNIPSWVFWPVWVSISVCDAIYGVLFFRDNTDFGTIYQVAAWVYFGGIVAMLAWNWLYFDLVNLYIVGGVGVIIMLTHGALLGLTIAYGGQHWFTILIIAVPLAWTTFAAVGSVLIAVWEGDKLDDYKKRAGKMMIAFLKAFDPANQRFEVETPGGPSQPASTSLPLPPPPVLETGKRRTVFS